MKLGKSANISTAIVWRDTSLVDMMKGLVDHAGALHLDYSVKFVDAKTKDIVDDTQSVNHPPTRSRGMYNRCTLRQAGHQELGEF